MRRVHKRRDRHAGVYIHVPFCARICPYCDFAVTSLKRVPHKAYAEALLTEFEARAEALDGARVRTIYFGGGTPSRWSPDALARVLGRVRERAQEVEEITIEANPVDITRDAMETWRGAGVTRVSLGVQSFDDALLKALGRVHSGEEAFGSTRELLKGGFDVSIDFIYGHALQSESMLEEDIERVRVLCDEHGLSHLSAYFLTIEEGTPFARLAERGEALVQGERAGRRAIERLREGLDEVGLAFYEASSFSLPGKQSKHNSNYWRGGEYLGLGMGAHGLSVDAHGRGRVERRQNAMRLSDYLADPIGSATLIEHVSPADHLDERVFVGMRSRFGVDLEEITAQFELKEEHVGELQRRFIALCEGGLVRDLDGVYSPTWAGMQVADMVGAKLLGVLS